MIVLKGRPLGLEGSFGVPSLWKMRAMAHTWKSAMQSVEIPFRGGYFRVQNQMWKFVIWKVNVSCCLGRILKGGRGKSIKIERASKMWSRSSQRQRIQSYYFLFGTCFLDLLRRKWHNRTLFSILGRDHCIVWERKEGETWFKQKIWAGVAVCSENTSPAQGCSLLGLSLNTWQ